MFCDNQFNFCPSPGQTVTTAGGAANSTNVFDAGVAKKLFGGAGGKGPKLSAIASALAGASTTLRVQLVGADDAALTSNVVTVADSGTSRILTAADLPFPMELVPADQLDLKRYYGLIITVAGSSGSVTLVANLVEDAQTFRTGN